MSATTYEWWNIKLVHLALFPQVNHPFTSRQENANRHDVRVAREATPCNSRLCSSSTINPFLVKNDSAMTTKIAAILFKTPRFTRSKFTKWSRGVLTFAGFHDILSDVFLLNLSSGTCHAVQSHWVFRVRHWRRQLALLQFPCLNPLEHAGGLGVGPSSKRRLRRAPSTIRRTMSQLCFYGFPGVWYCYQQVLKQRPRNNRLDMLSNTLFKNPSKTRATRMQPSKLSLLNKQFQQPCALFPCSRARVDCGAGKGVGCTVWSVQTMDRWVGNVVCRDWSGVCGVWSVDCKVQSVESTLPNVEFGAQSVECGG